MVQLVVILLFCFIINIKYCDAYLRTNHYYNHHLKNNHISKLYASKLSFNRILDIDQNGKIDIGEVQKAVLSHSSLLKHFNINFKTFFKTIFNINLIKAISLEIKSIMSPLDIVVIASLLSIYKPIMRFLYNITHQKKTDTKLLNYEKSFIGSLEQPITYVLWFPPILLLVDIFAMISLNVMKAMDISISKQIKLKNLSRLVYIIYSSITFGSFTTKMKDWILYKQRSIFLKNKSTLAINNNEDDVKDKITNEISSIIIWIVISLFCLEALSIELGIALGSLFTLGGISSASFILALKSTMENMIGGILLKLQDKFRVGETISIPDSSDTGEVEEMFYLATRVRLSDDSIISIPNLKFIEKEVVNWSRTPYRLFKTEITIKDSNILQLSTIINTLRTELTSLSGVETKERDLIISAKGFDDNEIIIEIDAKLAASNDLELSNIRTLVVNKIAFVLDNIQKN